MSVGFGQPMDDEKLRSLIAQVEQSFPHNRLHGHGTVSVGFCFSEIDGVEVKVYI